MQTLSCLPEPIDNNLLKFDTIESESELLVIDPDVSGDVDTLHVREFLRDIAPIYVKNNLTSVWKVTHEGQIIAFFTASMNSVGWDIIPQESRVEEMSGRYPAMLLGQMWVGPSFRGRQVAYWICQYVIGLARKIKPKVACSCVILQTDDDERKIKPYTKARFVRTKTSNGKIWMHRSTA